MRLSDREEAQAARVREGQEAERRRRASAARAAARRRGEEPPPPPVEPIGLTKAEAEKEGRSDG
jgi:hypothetical protein